MQLSSFTDFSSALLPDAYAPVPDDWLVAVSDVLGSTAAIAAGRYKDVNLAGAATIAAIQNACPEDNLPFAFGGDGATVLIPREREATARSALAGIHRISREALQLEMRCALVPVSEVRARGRDIAVALHALSPARTLAMIAGGGLECAEALAKAPEGREFMISATPETTEPDLSGLSCRWQPLVARNGVMVSLIIRARHGNEGRPAAYATLYKRLTGGLDRSACPVSVANLRSGFPPRGAKLERRFGASLFGVYGEAFLGKLSEMTGLTIGGFNAAAYRASLQAHSDYRKFADSLRMVIDCSPGESARIEAILEAARAEKDIDFGLHRAEAALMTCFVSTTDEGKHVHFIDGADGGYAIAAQQLKAQLSTNS